MPKVGPEMPYGQPRRARYVGSDPVHFGHTALVCQAPRRYMGGTLMNPETWVRPTGWLVQVDDRSNPCAFGWWYFPTEDWRPNVSPFDESI